MTNKMNTNQGTALTNQDAFNTWKQNRDKNDDVIFPVEIWQAATKASEQRIQELKDQLNEITRAYDNLTLNIQAQEQLGCELTASNNQLREALEKCKPLSRYGLVGTKDTEQAEFQKYIDAALSSTPTQSLIEHDNEVLLNVKNLIIDILGDTALCDRIIDAIGDLKP